MKEPVNSSHRWRKLFWARGRVWNFFWQVRIGLFDRGLRNIGRQIGNGTRLRTWGRLGWNGRHGEFLSRDLILSQVGLFRRSGLEALQLAMGRSAASLLQFHHARFRVELRALLQQERRQVGATQPVAGGFIAWFRKVHRTSNEIIKEKGGLSKIYPTREAAKAAAGEAILAYINGHLVRDGETLQASSKADALFSNLRPWVRARGKERRTVVERRVEP